MRFENRRWLVIPTSIISSIDFNQVLEPNADSLRKSTDETKTFVKYDVKVIEETYTETYENPETGEDVNVEHLAGVYGRPSIYSEEYTEYTHSEVLEMLNTDAWSPSETEE
jgi:hypothetical protein